MNELTKSIAACAAWAIVCVDARAAAQQPVVVGVLEQRQCEPKAPQSVRAMFVKRGGAWEAITSRSVERSFVMPTEWTLAFDGRDRGRVFTTRDSVPSASWYLRDRSLTLRPGQTPLRIPATGTAFAGWCENPEVRPIVVVSAPNATDPDGWRPFTITRADIERLLSAFRAATDSVVHCPRDPAKTEPFRFVASDVEAVRGYQDDRGRRLASVKLRYDRYRCEYMPEPAWDNHWFELGDVPWLVGRGLTLVDAGDYDQDGKSELVFWASGYNRDGYVLLMSDLRRRFDVMWSYH